MLGSKLMILKHCPFPEPAYLLLCMLSLSVVLFSLGPAQEWGLSFKKLGRWASSACETRARENGIAECRVCHALIRVGNFCSSAESHKECQTVIEENPMQTPSSSFCCSWQEYMKFCTAQGNCIKMAGFVHFLLLFIGSTTSGKVKVEPIHPEFWQQR